jgi:hypothetical protein
VSAKNDTMPANGNDGMDPWLPMVVIAMGQALMSFHAAALPISMSGMVESSNTAPTTVGTVVIMYSMGVSGFVMLGAKLGQRFGSKLFFQSAVGMILVALIMMVTSVLMELSGDVDSLRGTENTGRLVATVEYRYDIGAQPPSVIGRQNGTLINTVNTFNDRGGEVRDAYCIQRLFDARLRILVGRADISDYVGAHLMQNANNSLVSRHFAANPAVPFPGHGPMAGFSLRPTELFYTRLRTSF